MYMAEPNVDRINARPCLVQELPELAELTKMFSSKYGREMIMKAKMEDIATDACQVSVKLVDNLTLQPPSDRAKFERFISICEEHNVKLDANTTAGVRPENRALSCGAFDCVACETVVLARVEAGHACRAFGLQAATCR